ncbi:MAG: hypothetical protein CVV03_12820 [Firmicutes bacterium HGW-Firmicutes-8]|nr:MAG: hypothetical protein CVV03_12820 [Firmicutes bacterium HGW-Firmicutes-8]
MKKLLIVILTLLMLVGISANSIAVPSPKEASVSLTSSAATVKPGEIVTLTAVTLKQGSAYTDEWIGATKIETVLNEDGYYVSTAEVTAQATVTVQYKITMTAGKGGVTFTGEAETAVSVEKPADVVGVEVKNINPNLQFAGLYRGEVYVILSDGTSREYGAVSFGVSEGETSKLVYVSVAGQKYSCTVNI